MYGTVFLFGFKPISTALFGLIGLKKKKQATVVLKIKLLTFIIIQYLHFNANLLELSCVRQNLTVICETF